LPRTRPWREIKKQHPNEILFYRVGDFYEMFYDDALTASRELELISKYCCIMGDTACSAMFHTPVDSCWYVDVGADSISARKVCGCVQCCAGAYRMRPYDLSAPHINL